MGYQRVFWCRRRVGDYADARGQLELGVNHRASLPPSPHRWPEFNWLVLPASHPAASQPLQISQPTQDFLRQCFKVRRLASTSVSLLVSSVFKQELPSCHAWRAGVGLCATPLGKWGGLWLFLPLLVPSWRLQCKEFGVLLDSVYRHIFILWKQFWKLVVWRSYPLLIAYKKREEGASRKRVVCCCA